MGKITKLATVVGATALASGAAAIVLTKTEKGKEFSKKVGEKVRELKEGMEFGFESTDIEPEEAVEITHPLFLNIPEETEEN